MNGGTGAVAAVPVCQHHAPYRFMRTALISLTQMLGRRRRAPHIARAIPDLWLLRTVAVPGPWLKITKVLVENFVELGEELYDLVVRIAMIRIDVVPRAVTPGPPRQLHILAAEKIAGRENLR